ncbi:MAG: class I SAM-dependent methyltransferase [Candidatus Omnitrophota bacterium]
MRKGNKLYFRLVIFLGLAACSLSIVQLCRITHSPYTKAEASPDGTGKFYMGREIAGMISGHGAIEWLERHDREQTEKPRAVINALALKPDDVVADIGAGSGYFTFRIAPLVPEGKVYTVEIGPEMIDHLEQKKRDLDLQNVIVQRGQIDAAGLADNSVDVAFMVDAYHEFSHPREMMRSIVRALKADGRVVFVEYRGEDPQLPIKPLHKMTVNQLRKEMKAAGLVWIKTIDVLPSQHISIFMKN